MASRASTQPAPRPEPEDGTALKSRPRRPRGRPRESGTDAAINQAVIELLAEVGYQRLSYDLVAQRAKATRPTVYRRGANKVLLVLGALIEHYGTDPTPDTGSLATDLFELQKSQIRFWNDPVIAGLFPGLLADISNDPQLAETWWQSFIAPRRASTARALERARQRGELKGSPDPEWICDLITGPLICRAFLGGYRKLPESLAEETVKIVLKMYGKAK
ncbi:TetR/AcrR family transcriptional regulator [Inquilinus limosus]|uniref:TetR/AcrR family transcriptional regulator n=1 Tax=Inquilinus limosus TaxID=171674 RepID=UPI003F141F2E